VAEDPVVFSILGEKEKRQCLGEGTDLEIIFHLITSLAFLQPSFFFLLVLL